MKGIVFTEFFDLVESAFGLEMKDRIIRAARLANDGAYTAVGNYDSRELLALAVELSRATGKPVRDLEVAFGQHIFQRFVRDYGHFFKAARSSFEFLAHIHDYIHVEVRKLYPDAELPAFSYPLHDRTTLVMEYKSPRPLAAFAEGLIRATIAYYRENITLRVEDLSGGAGTAARFHLKTAA